VAISVRSLNRGDLPAALAIQSATYPPFLIEHQAAFASRLDLPDSYCLAATRNGTLVAYLLAHGWPAEAPPPVNTILQAKGPSEVLFIHDLAVSCAARGSGIGHRLIERALELAAGDGLRVAELIAVEGAASYWRRLGFAESGVSAPLVMKVATYGADARWMTRGIPQALAHRELES
jgi:predicted N-acetyltransferase YhbS